jgi:hypothetical protein
MSALFIGMYWLIEFLGVAGEWADTGKWQSASLLQLMQRYSIAIPHTEMIGFQNIIDFCLAQPGLIWVGLVGMVFANISVRLRDQSDGINGIGKAPPKVPKKLT